MPYYGGSNSCPHPGCVSCDHTNIHLLVAKMNDSLIHGNIDIVSESGTVEGWAIDGNTRDPCYVQIRAENQVVGEDIADKFRPDLLEARLGHGHYAFYARISRLDAGNYPLRLFNGRTGAPIGYHGDQVHHVPRYVKPPIKIVDELLQRRICWEDKDIIAAPSCLQLDRNYLHFGPERFVDRVFRFALGRWADPAAITDYCKLLAEQRMTPTEHFLAVLGSSERQAQTRRLSRPDDPDFPFVYDSESVVRAFLSAQIPSDFPADLDL